MDDRSQILINNLLSEICSKTDIPREQYRAWLLCEVGFTEEELFELEENGCIPWPER